MISASDIQELPGDALMYGQNKMREEHWEWHSNNPKLLPQQAWLIRTDEIGEDASILRIFFRMLESKKRTLRAVGIGGVWTRPDLRGQGYGKLLMQKTMAKLRDEQHSADVAILFAQESAWLYVNAGFGEIAPGLYAKSIHEDLRIELGPEWKVNPEGHF